MKYTCDTVIYTIDTNGRMSAYSDWYSEFLFYPRIINKSFHWFETVYWRTDYVNDKFEYKTKKQFIIDELRKKN